ncbi:MAG: cation:proton antiporter [Fibrobacteres bacterium]|nr:cation:proton antiporter [Fibrobacterota bacterium]
MGLGTIVFLLLATVILVPLAMRLGIGSAMAYLLAGVLAGPHLVGLMSDPASLSHAAEFGVVIMLFLVGLELRPRELWRLRGPLVALGAGQVAGTTALVALVGWIAGLSWQGSLAVGAAMAMSSTALALPSLRDRGLGGGPTGQGALAILLFQDIAVIPLLALLPLLATSGVPDMADTGGLGFLPGFVRTPLAMVVLAVVLVATQWAAKHVFRWLALSRQREALTAMGLLLVSGISLVAGTVGLSAALGAFLGGVLLADSEYRHEIEADLEPFRGLFLGFFFATVGAGLNLPLILSKPILVASLALGLFALKVGVLWLLARSARMNPSDRLPLALGLAQVGEFAFVLLAVSRGSGLMSGDLAGLLGGAVAVSMPLTPLSLMVWSAAQRRNMESVAQPAEGAASDALVQVEAPVLLAGFGRMGSMVGRVLKAQGIPVSVLDLDPHQVAHMRRLGLEPHFGDARREELLKAAGLAQASLLVVMVDDQEDGLDIVRTARETRPSIPVILRVHSHQGAYHALGLENVEPIRETFGAAMEASRLALEQLGWRSTRALRAVELFVRHNQASMRELAKVDRSSEDWLRLLRERIDEASNLVREDADPRHLVDRAWDNESLRTEFFKKE